MRKNIFYFERLRRFDYISIILYLLLSLVLLGFNYSNSPEANRTLIFAYGWGTSMFLYFFCYRSLRNLTVYFIWIIIALIHFYIYLQIKDEPALIARGGHVSLALRNVILMLLLFQVLRFVNIKVQNQELVAPARGSQTDLFDERKVNIADFISFVIYMASLALLSFVV